ncbi:MAG: M23 family metallopeptidase [Candidatus Micrarchaeia archaeon]
MGNPPLLVSVPSILKLGEASAWASKSRNEMKKSVWLATLPDKTVRAVVRYTGPKGLSCIYDPSAYDQATKTFGIGYSERMYKKIFGVDVKSMIPFSLPGPKKSDLELLKDHVPPFGILGASRHNSSTERHYKHTGIDIYGPEGTALFAPSDGTVVRATNEKRAGNFIEINDGTYFFRFLHCKELLADFGAHVFQGEKIGTLGSTGNARYARSWILSGGTGKTGKSHLHLEVRGGNVRNGTPFDGIALLEEGLIGVFLDVENLK